MRESQDKPKYSYMDDVFAREDSVLQKVRQEAQNLDLEGMQVQAYEGKILQLLVQLSRAERVLEIGTFLGYSTLWMARALPENGKITCLEKSEEHAAKARHFFAEAGFENKIEVFCGDAEELLASIGENNADEQGVFDLIFIDANKGAYERYLDWAFKNVSVGGLIIGDNTFLFDNVYLSQEESKMSKNQWLAMRAFNQKLADAEDFVSAMLPTPEGMTVGLRVK